MDTIQPQEDDGYEYQYDETETETFLVDLDLSSANPAIKSSSARKTPNKSTINHNRQAFRDPVEIAESFSEGDEDGAGPTGSVEKVQRPRGRPKQALKSFRMLDFDTSNPIIAYNDHLYDCSWTDMVGTNMFFDLPGSSTPIRPTLSDKDLVLTGTSRIKLVAYRAKLSKAEPQKRKHSELREDSTIDGRGLPGFKSGNAQNNIDIKKQAEFLGRLMDAKKRRGEKDLVTVIPGPLNSQQPGTVSSERSRPEIDALNRRVVKGDIDALSELQAINSRTNISLDEATQTPNELPIAGTAQSPSTEDIAVGESVSDHG